MKKYFVEIDGQKIEVTKEISDVIYGNSGESRRERYVMEELSKKHESSLEYLIDCSIPIEQLIIGAIAPSPEEQIITQMKYKDLYHAINSLSKTEKKIIMMIFFYEMTEHEIAFLLDCSQPNVSRTKTRAIKKLKRSFLKLFLSSRL